MAEHGWLRIYLWLGDEDHSFFNTAHRCIIWSVMDWSIQPLLSVEMIAILTDACPALFEGICCVGLILTGFQASKKRRAAQTRS